MPIPKKKSNESEREFLSRCMGDSEMIKEFENRNQRFGVCISQLKKS